MRKDFIESEFQFAVMTGYYTLFRKREGLDLHMPSGKVEHDEAASDWVFNMIEGVPFYLQFKRSFLANANRLRDRQKQTKRNADKAGVLEFSQLAQVFLTCA